MSSNSSSKLTSSRLALLLCLLSVSALSGCGGGNPNVPTPVSPVPQTTTTTTVLIQPTVTGLAPRLGAAFVDFNIPSVGTLDVEFNWTFASNDVDIYLTTSTCPSLSALANGGCTVLASDESLQKPARLSVNITQSGSARFWAVNFGSSAESGSGTIRLTTTR